MVPTASDGDLVVRDLDEEAKSRLRVQAAEHGRSMEAEARALLTTALTGHRLTRGLGSYIRGQFADMRMIEPPVLDRDERARLALFIS